MDTLSLFLLTLLSSSILANSVNFEIEDTLTSITSNLKDSIANEFRSIEFEGLKSKINKLAGLIENELATNERSHVKIRLIFDFQREFALINKILSSSAIVKNTVECSDSNFFNNFQFKLNSINESLVNHHEKMHSFLVKCFDNQNGLHTLFHDIKRFLNGFTMSSPPKSCWNYELKTISAFKIKAY